MIFGVVLLLCGGATAQAPKDPQFDPSDVYFQAYMEIRTAEQLEKEGAFVEAMTKYERARKLFDAVDKFYPEWKAGMVDRRRELNDIAIDAVKEKAREQMKEKKGVIAELEGGVTMGGQEMELDEDPESILEVDPLKARRLEEAEVEVQRLKDEIAKEQAERREEQMTREAAIDPRSNEAMRNAARVGDLRKRNELYGRKLKAAEDEVRKLKSQMATEPMQNEMQNLNNRIKNLEQEREAMGMALKTSRGDHMEALSKIEILTADMELLKDQAKELRQKEANLERDLKAERKVANQVVAGQLKQMKALEKALGAKSDELKVANERIAGLQEELDQSRAAFNELRKERDSLLQERDQMAALLKLNESGRIEQLIEQNMSMAKSLREANEKVERLNKDNNAAKDDVVDALRDLAIAKSQINRLHQEKKDQDNRLKELTERLKGEEKALGSGMVSSDPAEVEMLREVIRRQLRLQERRKQAKELMVKAVRALGKKDERLEEAIKLFDGTKMELSVEEQKLVADQQVDGEFISPFARDSKTVGRNTANLNLDLQSYDRAATKAFLAGRLLPTRELFEMMIDLNPGHVPALCKLGLVQMKLGEPLEAAESFQKAIELDENNQYANFMMGFTSMKLGDLNAAERFTKQAVELAPDDGRSYRLLGSIHYGLGRVKDAEESFKSAISVDPVPSEPYFNLALIYTESGKLDEAREFYLKALERGAVPDASLAAKIGEVP
ncbi:MAG: tetratricopeptide repeat protein [Luteolibacter sp.]